MSGNKECEREMAAIVLQVFLRDIYTSRFGELNHLKNPKFNQIMELYEYQLYELSEIQRF